MNPLLVTLVLGTATPGGGFPVYGEAFADMVNAQEPALAIQTKNTDNAKPTKANVQNGTISRHTLWEPVLPQTHARFKRYDGTELTATATMFETIGDQSRTA